MSVSVVIPVYNEEKYIEKCLLSLQDQTELPNEIIIVDNNCVDNTISIAKNFSVKIIKEKKQGMIPARNRGFNSAKYNLIARCDADSTLPKNWIKRIKQNFASKNIDGLSGPGQFYDLPFSNQLSNLVKFIYFKIFKKIYGHEMLFGSNMIITNKIWQKIKNEICLDDKKVHEDIDLSVHISKYSTIRYDPLLTVYISGRRLTNPHSLFEYPYRWIKSLINHQ